MSRSRFYSNTEPEYVGCSDADVPIERPEPEFDPCADDEDADWVHFQSVAR